MREVQTLMCHVAIRSVQEQCEDIENIDKQIAGLMSQIENLKARGYDLTVGLTESLQEEKTFPSRDDKVYHKQIEKAMKDVDVKRITYL